MRLVTSAIVAALLLVVPATASASQRSGDATDPAGDSAGLPYQDIISADVQYDTDGELLVAARMNGDLQDGQEPIFLDFRVAEYTPPSACTGDGVDLAGFSDDQSDLVKVDGVDEEGNEPIAYSGNDDIVFAAQGSALANKGYSCMTLFIQEKGGTGRTLDQLNVPLWFDGSGPPAVTCKAPKVKGLTLAAATKVIKKAHCTVGKVTKPKHVKRGFRLVVVKQKTKGTAVALTLGPKRKH